MENKDNEKYEVNTEALLNSYRGKYLEEVDKTAKLDGALIYAKAKQSMLEDTLAKYKDKYGDINEEEDD